MMNAFAHLFFFLFFSFFFFFGGGAVVRWSAFLGNATALYFPLVGDWWGANPRFRLYVNESRYVSPPSLVVFSPLFALCVPSFFFIFSFLFFFLVPLCFKIYNDLYENRYFMTYDEIREMADHQKSPKHTG